MFMGESKLAVSGQIRRREWQTLQPQSLGLTQLLSPMGLHIGSGVKNDNWQHIAFSQICKSKVKK
jgi:hypothetical protein